MKRIVAICLLALTLSGCKITDLGRNAPPNILLIIADDMGKDATAGFAEGTIKPTTPNLDRIRNNGISFHNFWTYPSCSPTRASIITGKYGYRSGITRVHQVIDPKEVILQRYVKENSSAGYATAIVGKWHLSGKTNTTFNPETMGVDYYAGLVAGSAETYNSWQLTEDGVTTLQSSYITTAFTDLAINWVNAQEKPWFLWLAYTAPHTPIHIPPAGMHSQGTLPPYHKGLDVLPYHTAMIESMDYEIGRFLNSIPPIERDNTVIIFMGDNGTFSEATQAPYSSTKSKRTLYQGGINNPLFVSGPGIKRIGDDYNLITSTDLYSTIAELAGVYIPEVHDSKSFKHLFTGKRKHRNFQYCESTDGTLDAHVISNGHYKLFVHKSGKEELYDLSTDPYENTDLMTQPLTPEQQAAVEMLKAELARIRN